jgi:hypothetical protein
MKQGIQSLSLAFGRNSKAGREVWKLHSEKQGGSDFKLLAGSSLTWVTRSRASYVVG